MKMPKTVNPYPKGSMTWALMEGDWEDLTVSQIAEILASTPGSIRTTIERIKRDTGYEVPRTKGRPGRKPEE